MQTRIKKIQTVLFIRNLNILNDIDRAAFFTEVNKNIGDIFDGQKINFPVPNDAPLEIPRFILNSAEGDYSCNISISRVDIFYNILEDNDEDLESLLAVQNSSVQIVLNFLRDKGIIVNRIGFVVEVEGEMELADGSGPDYVRNNFILEDRLKSPKELMLRYNQYEKLDNFDMNNLLTINSSTENSISFLIDINTAKEMMSEVDFSDEDIDKIMDYAIKRVKHCTDNFPEV